LLKQKEESIMQRTLKTLTKNTTYLILVFFIIFSTGVAAAAESNRRLITVDDLTAFHTVASPVFSPDGQHIAYTISSNNYEKNQSTTRIWMIPATGGEPIPMTAASASSSRPVFSKDGYKLYYLSARGEQKPQLWSLDLKSGGEGRQVTDFERGINQINFSSDETRLLLMMKDEDTSEPLVEGSKPWVVDRLTFKADYRGYLNHLRNHIYVYDIGSKQLEQLTSGDFDDAQPAWAPDNGMVAFTSNRNPGADSNTDIWLVSATPGKEARQLTSNTAADSSPKWHPAGKSLAYLSAIEGIEPNYAIQHLARINIDGSGAQRLSEELDRRINNLKFSDDGSFVYFQITDSGERHIARMRWKDGELERLVSGKAIISSFALGHTGQIAGIISTLSKPGELFIHQGEQSTLLTRVNKHLVDQLELAHTEEIHFEAPDGWPIEGFVTFPPGFKAGQRYPTLLQIHGGPVGQYGHGFSLSSQLWAAQGYVVVRSNPRGSSGYGQAFTLGLYQGWGENDFRDVLAAVDYAIEQGYADPDRLGVGGYSYGGILTNYLLGHTQRFKAATSGAGSGHYLASYGHDEYREWYETELGLPWENRELWERLSPFNSIHKATTPTLFYGGEKDWNVPIQGSEQLYQVMKRVGIEVQLVVYPDEHHGGWSFANEKDAWLRRIAWYKHYLKPAE
jgi:dipeptidyl aminopeptidase/acylaminoacyl peptidase